ncbi:unnamed protein product [Prorocentrum cordatum]|uniref:Potassium channel tetramerisation-type BTB domain-containing protein n=1 Tax=Prorocentrum cordatum TaxID=2364126 RepID=A0ABN9V5H3_9DINO|nr:unnamed protein product [Polarella glacialis]
MAEPSYKRPRVVLTASRHEGPRAGSGLAAAQVAADPIALTLTPVAKANLPKEAPLPAAKATRAARETAGPRSEAPPAQAKPVQKAPEQGPVAVFDACGTIFKVPAQVVKAKPDTLLAKLLEASSGAPAANRPVFVDCAPDRFSCILDWYRYGEIHLSRTCPWKHCCSTRVRCSCPASSWSTAWRTAPRPPAALARRAGSPVELWPR